MIYVDNRSGFRVARARVAAAAEAVLAAEKAGPLNVSVTIVGDAEIHVLNRAHLAHDYPTDVISFGLREPDDPDPLLGEVVVSSDRARAEAKARGIPAAEELLRYVVHGCLHLLGHDDRTPRERAKMHRRQEAILAGIAAPKVERASRKARRSPAPAAPLDAHGTFEAAWLALTPKERAVRSWALRARIPDPEAWHDAKLFPRP